MDKNWLLYIGVVVTNDLHKLFGEEFEVTVRWEQVQEKVEETKDDFFQGEQRNGIWLSQLVARNWGLVKINTLYLTFVSYKDFLEKGICYKIWREDSCWASILGQRWRD